MESIFTNYLLDHTFLTVVIAIVVVIAAIAIVKSMLRIVIVLSVVGFLFITIFNVSPGVLVENGKNFADYSVGLVEGNFVTGLLEQLQDGELLVQEDNGDTVIEIDTLGIRYNITDWLTSFSTEGIEKLENS